MAETIDNPYLTEAKSAAAQLVAFAEQADDLISQFRVVMAGLERNESIVRRAVIQAYPNFSFAKSGQGGIASTTASTLADPNSRNIIASLAKHAWSELLDGDLI
jgi:hypothetical protein